MERRKILWLASWYPNRNDAFDGDFIQRHARAAAIYNDIHVIYVAEAEQEEAVREEFNYVTGLTEQFIYYKKPSGLFSRLRNHFTWQSIFRKTVAGHIGSHGLPFCIHVQVLWKAGLIAAWAKKKYGIPFILSEHSGMYGPFGHYDDMLPPARRLLLSVMKEANLLVTVSHYLSSILHKVTGRKADLVIPNVVDTSLFYPKDEKYSRFTFIHVSNMVPLKNAGLILKAFASLSSRKELPPAQLIMVGNRDDRMLLLAGDLGLLNVSVFFRGEIPYTEVAEEVRRSHCMVLFSDDETFSCVTAEALCGGLPVIASDRGALPELLDESQGRLVARSKPEMLENAMGEVLLHFSGFDRKGIAEKAAALYGYSAIAERFKTLYRHLPGADSTPD